MLNSPLISVDNLNEVLIANVADNAFSGLQMTPRHTHTHTHTHIYIYIYILCRNISSSNILTPSYFPYVNKLTQLHLLLVLHLSSTPPDVLIHFFSHSISPTFFFSLLYFLPPSCSFFSFHLAVSLPVPQYNLNLEHSWDPYTEYNTWNPCQLRNIIPSPLHSSCCYFFSFLLPPLIRFLPAIL
jgi:hypothetical protein